MSSLPADAAPAYRDTIRRALAEIDRVILGKERETRLAMCCLLARGHLLIEDMPGVGKTMLALTLAHVLGLQYRRIQFTSDLLPADLLGVAIFQRDESGFRFHPGPIFAQLVLADEINRATPKTQSALLEAMEERQVTTEGETRTLPQPFFVVATQNPIHQIGTFPLPESQLDRFLMRIDLGYPQRASERALLKGGDRRELVDAIKPCLDTETLLRMQQRVGQIYISESLLDYLQSILEYSRRPELYVTGLSPRSGVALKASAQAYAYMQGCDYVTPEHVQAVLPAVIGHRLHPMSQPRAKPADTAQALLSAVPIP